MGVITETLIKWAATQKAFSWQGAAVAYSGGADSTALLAASVEAAKQSGASFITAIHIHHGLQAAADAFELNCKTVCEQLSDAHFEARFIARRVQIELQTGDSVEQRAREARYEALCEAARQAGLTQVLLAQHADDQAESVLLALSRGAGLAGLAGMTASFERAGVIFSRPLLTLPGKVLKAYVRERNIAYVEDPTNNDERYTRNKFRAQLMPAVEQTMPAFRDTFARSARHAAEAQALLEQVAQADFALMREGDCIKLKAMCERLDPLRWPNLLRYWLKTVHQVTPSTAQLDELCAQIATSQRHGAPRNLRIKVAEGYAVRERDLLGFEATAA